MQIILWVRNLGGAQWNGLSPCHTVSPGTDHLGLEDPKWLHLSVWGLGAGCWLGHPVLHLAFFSSRKAWASSPVGWVYREIYLVQGFTMSLPCHI